MPLEVVDMRSGSTERLKQRQSGWDRPELGRDAATVRRILAEVRSGGDVALCAYAKSFDGAALTPGSLRVTADEIEQGTARTSEKILKALKHAAGAIREFHQAQLPAEWSLDRDGSRVGQVFRPIGRAGCYVPGGRLPYPSTVLMTAVPASVAGVKEIIICTPPSSDGSIPDVVCAAASVAGVNEIYKAGGAQAIAAMAYGTASISRVDKICGPGNVFVTLAKKEVFGTVGIDGLFGPSEVVVVATEDSNPDYAAAELLTQAEHAHDTSSILVTTSEQFLGDCLAAVWERLGKLARADDIRESLAANGLAVLVRDLDQAADVVNEIAPEHLCVHTPAPGAFLENITSAGAAILGMDTPAALSDYCAGPSHVLPTSGTARFQSGLSVRDFLVGINTVSYTRKAFFRDASAADALAEAEGLQAHRDDLRVRLEESP